MFLFLFLPSSLFTLPTIKKHAVEGSTSNIDYKTIASKIEPGGCYEITNFRTTRIRGQYNVGPHDAQLIFSGKIVFKKLSNLFPPIPRHQFFLQDYNTLYPHLNKVDIFTGDIIIHGVCVCVYFHNVLILTFSITKCHW